MIRRRRFLDALAARRTDEVVVTTMGAVRPWGQVGHHELDFASADSAMGHAADLALGVALARPDRRVVCLNGDGSMLMSLGTIVTIHGSGVTNLALVILNNGTYEITGNQPVPGSTDFAGVAHAAGWRHALRVTTEAEIAPAVEAVLSGPGPVLVDVRIRPGSEGPIGRSPAESSAYLQVSLAESARRVRRALDLPSAG